MFLHILNEIRTVLEIKCFKLLPIKKFLDIKSFEKTSIYFYSHPQEGTRNGSKGSLKLNFPNLPQVITLGSSRQGAE